MRPVKYKKVRSHSKAKRIAASVIVLGIAVSSSALVFADTCIGSIHEPVSIKPLVTETASVQTIKEMEMVSFLTPQTVQVQTLSEAAQTATSVAPPAAVQEKTTSSEAAAQTMQVSEPNTVKPAKETTMYTTASCYIRAKDVAGSNVLKSLKSGTKVTLTGQADNGYYIVKDGGYLHQKFLSEKPPVIQSAKTESSSQGSSATSSSGSASDGKHDGSIRGIINSASLNPSGTGFSNVDAKIDAIFDQIITSDMDTYEKVKACYDYLINNTSYRRNGGYPTAGYGNISNQAGNNYIAWAAMSTLDTGKGACNGYSAAFIAMVRKIGLKAGYASGETYSTSKGWMGHHWAEVYIGGETYIFDPQVEDNIAKGGKISYSRFCKTYAQSSKQYRK